METPFTSRGTFMNAVSTDNRNASQAGKKPKRSDGREPSTPSLPACESGPAIGALRQQAVAVDYCRRHVDQLPIRRARVFSEHLESRRLVDRVAFHENALSPLRSSSRSRITSAITDETTSPVQ